MTTVEAKSLPVQLGITLNLTFEYKYAHRILPSAFLSCLLQTTTVNKGNKHSASNLKVKAHGEKAEYPSRWLRESSVDLYDVPVARHHGGVKRVFEFGKNGINETLPK